MTGAVWLSVVAMCSCYYTSRSCRYFFDGECYENSTSLYSGSTCDAVVGGHYLDGRCYYNEPRNCSADEFYQQCTCYPHRSSTYTNYTCYNIDGFYRNGFCYYTEFNCPAYAVNGQCYSLVTSSSSLDIDIDHFEFVHNNYYQSSNVLCMKVAVIAKFAETLCL